MLLYEYDQEFHVNHEKSISLEKGKTPEVISDVLDEDLSRVQAVCEAAKESAPDYDYKKVYGALYGKSKGYRR